MQSFPPSRPANIIGITNALAQSALKDPDVQLFALLGDDLRFSSKTWLAPIKSAFDDMQAKTDIPGFGCVILNDRRFVGFPTFPVVSRMHIEIFNGWAPTEFVNQDADPWIWALYRHFTGALHWDKSSCVYNGIGGDSEPPSW